MIVGRSRARPCERWCPRTVVNTLAAVSLWVSAQRLGFRTAYLGLQVSWFLRRPETRGVKCLLTHGENILLVRHTYGRRVWDLPGGGIQRGEPPVATAAREMQEELGVSGVVWLPGGTIHGRQRFRSDTVHCFWTELPDPALEPNLAELAEVRWFSRAELPSNLGPYVRPMLAGTPAFR